VTPRLTLVRGDAAVSESAARTDPAFRHWLRELREQAGLTQDELAVAVGTDRRNIRRWEVEGHDPSGTMLLNVLSALGVELTPAPAPSRPGPVNAELARLQALVYEAEDSAARRHDELLARIEALTRSPRARRSGQPQRSE
jgi:transcriptional regulator with XRE-family HTH domain